MIRYGQGAVSRLATVCSLLLVMVTSAWGATASAPVKVAATIFPLYDLVRQVAGAAAEVVLLVPPGASPHTFTVKPGTVRVSQVAPRCLLLAMGWMIGPHGWPRKPVSSARS